MKQQESLYSPHPNFYQNDLRPRRRFYWERFFQIIDFKIMKQMQQYIDKHKKNFEKRSKKISVQPKIIQFQKRKPVIPFTIYQDFYLICKCKQNYQSLKKGTIFKELSLYLDRAQAYLVQRVKKKYPTMSYQDLQWCITNNASFKFKDKKFIRLKEKGKKIVKDISQKQENSDSNQQEIYQEDQGQIKQDFSTEEKSINVTHIVTSNSHHLSEENHQTAKVNMTSNLIIPNIYVVVFLKKISLLKHKQNQ